jgi:hypothetical protein
MREIEAAIGMAKQTAHDFVSEKVKSDEFGRPPASRQHFDIWQFQTSDKTAGQEDAKFNT